MKIDPYKNKENFLEWKSRNQNRIPEISKINSDLILKYLEDMEKGINIAKGSTKGARSYSRLNSLKNRMIFFSKKFKELYNLEDITKIKEEQVLRFFSDIREGLIKKEDGKEYKFNSIISNKKERYLLKPRSNETPQHFFMTFDIANYLKKFTDKVFLFQSVKPDIVFEINNKKYAIEVETGKMYINNKKGLIAKVKCLNKQFGKNWFFMMTNKKLTEKYLKLGQTCDKRTILNKINRIIRDARVA